MGYAFRFFTGRVIKYFRQEGYGFLHVDGIPRRAFFRVDDFDHALGGDELKLGDALEFYLVDAKKGLKAIRLSIRR
jgi:cold shock CspA family protein